MSHAGTPFEVPLRRELARLRAASDLAGELLPADIVDVLPPEAEAGAWGAVAVAEDRPYRGIGGGEPRLTRSRETVGNHNTTTGPKELQGGAMDTKTKRYLGLLLGAMFAISACTGTTPSAAPASQAAPSAEASVGPEHPGRIRLAEPARGRPGRGGHPERRSERRDRPLDVLAVADVRRLDQGHDRPLRGDVPGRQGQLGRPSGDLPGRPQELVRGRQRPGRHQPVGRRGLGVRLRHP